MLSRILFLFILYFEILFATNTQVVVISAEGLADPNADIYKKDKALMIDDLRRDAKKQLIEKAVGAYVNSYTLVENYVTIEDRILSQSQGLIKRVIKESPHWIGKDGFAHMLIKAEVFVGKVEDALQELSKAQKIGIIKSNGNPRISVSIKIRGKNSVIAENKLKEHIKSFGYTVWSERGKKEHQKTDFTIEGEAKFKTLKYRLKASGITIEKIVLTSWSVNCIDRSSLEEIYFNNKVPKKKSWNSEEEAIEEIGTIIGKEFSSDFFIEKMNNPIKNYVMEVENLPSIDVAQLFKKEFIGLRSIYNVNFRRFNTEGTSVYEVDFAGIGGNLTTVLNEGVINPINKKLGRKALKLIAYGGNVLNLKFYKEEDNEKIVKTLQSLPPASLIGSSKERLEALVKTDESRKKLENLISSDNDNSMSSIENF